jgi:hypothetical protein
MARNPRSVIQLRDSNRDCPGGVKQTHTPLPSMPAWPAPIRPWLSLEEGRWHDGRDPPGTAMEGEAEDLGEKVTQPRREPRADHPAMVAGAFVSAALGRRMRLAGVLGAAMEVESFRLGEQVRESRTAAQRSGRNGGRGFSPRRASCSPVGRPLLNLPQWMPRLSPRRARSTQPRLSRTRRRNGHRPLSAVGCYRP